MTQAAEIKSLRAKEQSDREVITNLNRELQAVRSALAAIDSKKQGISSVLSFGKFHIYMMIVPKSPLRKVLVREATNIPGVDHSSDSILTILWNANNNLKSIIHRMNATALASSPVEIKKSDLLSDSTVIHDRLRQIQMRSRQKQTEELVIDLSGTQRHHKWIKSVSKPVGQLSTQVEQLVGLSTEYHDALQTFVPCTA